MPATPEGLLIREAFSSDISEIVSLVNRAYRPRNGIKGWTHEADLIQGQRTNEQLVRDCMQQAAILIACLNEKIVACIQVEADGVDAHLGMLAVEPSIQAAGIGKTVLAAAEDYASRLPGVSRLVLVVVRSRKELVDFYLRRGYEMSNERLPYPRDRSVGTPVDESLDLIILHKGLVGQIGGNL